MRAEVWRSWLFSEEVLASVWRWRAASQYKQVQAPDLRGFRQRSSTNEFIKAGLPEIATHHSMSLKTETNICSHPKIYQNRSEFQEISKDHVSVIPESM